MRVKVFGGVLALAIAGLSGVALAQGGSGLVGGQYTLTWSADHGSGSEQICLNNMEEFRDPAHVVAAYLNDYNPSCSTSSRGGGVYDVSCSGTLVEGTFTVLSSGQTSLSVSGGVLMNTDGQGGRQRLSARISLQRDGDC
jgi:hypothetical protein